MSQPSQPISIEEINNRLSYHPASDPDIQRQHDQARAIIINAAQEMVDLVPPGREASLMATHLEEALMWANKAIAMQGPYVSLGTIADVTVPGTT